MNSSMRRAFGASAICMLSVASIRSEVSVDSGPGFVNAIILGTSTEDPDPIGVFWIPYRSIEPARVLNASGAIRGDGRPDIVFKSIVEDPDPLGSPAVVWAYNNGSDRDVAFSEWTDGAWSGPEFLTLGVEDELDPRVFIDEEGRTYVTWWTDGMTDRVYLTERAPGSASWSAPAEATSNGRRPSVAVADGAVRVSFERTSAINGTTNEVVVVRRDMVGAFIEEAAIETQRANPLDSVLHVRPGALWLDWKHDVAVFGHVEHLTTAWSTAGQAAWTSPTWTGVEETRRIIEGLVGN